MKETMNMGSGVEHVPTKEEIEINGGMKVPEQFVKEELNPTLEQAHITKVKEEEKKSWAARKIADVKNALNKMFEGKETTVIEDIKNLNTITIDNLSGDTGRGSSTLAEYPKMIQKYSLGNQGEELYKKINEQAKITAKARGTETGVTEQENLNDLKQEFFSLMREKAN